MVLQVFSFGFPSNMYLVVRMTEAGVKGGKNFLYGKASEPCSVKYCLTNWILSVFPHLWFKKCIEASKIKASIMSINHLRKNWQRTLRVLEWLILNTIMNVTSHTLLQCVSVARQQTFYSRRLYLFRQLIFFFFHAFHSCTRMFQQISHSCAMGWGR